MAEKFPKEIYLQGNLRLDQETTKRKDARFHDKIYKDPGPTQRPNNSIPLTEFIQEKIDNEEIIIPEQDCDCKECLEDPITNCDYIVEDISLCSEDVQPYYLVQGLEITEVLNEIQFDMSKVTIDVLYNIIFGLPIHSIVVFLSIQLIDNSLDTDEEVYDAIRQCIDDYNNHNENINIHYRYYSDDISISYVGNVITFKCNNRNRSMLTIGFNLPLSQEEYEDAFYIVPTAVLYNTEVNASLVDFGVDFGDGYVIKTGEVVNGEWRYYDLINPPIRAGMFGGFFDLTETPIQFIENPECEGNKSFEVLINGEWVDKTNEVTEQGIWELLNTTDEVTAWRYVDSEGEGEPTPIVGDCATTEPDTYNICEKINNHEERIIILENSGSSLEFENGVKILDNDKIGLGGSLTQDTIVDSTENTLDFNISKTSSAKNTASFKIIGNANADSNPENNGVGLFLGNSWSNVFASTGLYLNAGGSKYTNGLEIIAQGASVGAGISGKSLGFGTGLYFIGETNSENQFAGTTLRGKNNGTYHDIIIDPVNGKLVINNIPLVTESSNIYVEGTDGKVKKISSNILKTFKISLNFIDETVATIKAPQNMKINSITTESSTPTIKVNNVAYVLGNPITQFDEIEITATVDTLVILNCE